MKVCVSLLAYNEARTLRETIERSYRELEQSRLEFELWIFDNHSTDNTMQIVDELKGTRPRLHYFRQPRNVGYAMSTQSSFKIPKADVYLTIDGDGQYRMHEVALFVDDLMNGRADIIFAWRVKRNDPADRLVMSNFFNMIAKIVLPSKLHDMNCGYRAMTRRAAEMIDIKHPLKFVGPEIYARATQIGLKIAEREVDHYPRLAGESVYNDWRAKIASSLGMLRYLLSLRFDILFKSQRGALPAERSSTQMIS